MKTLDQKPTPKPPTTTRYMVNAEKEIFVMVRPEGKAIFTNQAGFEVKDAIDIMTQDATVRMLREQGFEEFSWI